MALPAGRSRRSRWANRAAKRKMEGEASPTRTWQRAGDTRGRRGAVDSRSVSVSGFEPHPPIDAQP